MEGTASSVSSAERRRGRIVDDDMMICCLYLLSSVVLYTYLLPYFLYLIMYHCSQSSISSYPNLPMYNII